MGRTERKSWFPAILGVMVVGAVVLIVNSSFSGGVYDYELRDLQSDWAQVEGREVRVAGTVVPGSIRGDHDKLDITFDIQDAENNRLSVRYRKVLPDPFAENRQVIVEGRLTDPGHLDGRSLTVKCPSRYQDGSMSEAEANNYYRERHPHDAPGAASAPPESPGPKQ